MNDGNSDTHFLFIEFPFCKLTGRRWNPQSQNKTAPVKSLEGSWNFELTHIGISWVSVFL